MRLTPLEYRLLTLLANSAGRVVSNPHLLCEVWGPTHVDDIHYLRIYVGHFRQKLEDDPAQPRYLLMETTLGYRPLLSP